jgi:hypothetical protein
VVYISITYAYTEQPWEEQRILLFLMICVTVTLTAQACGFFIGVITPFKVLLLLLLLLLVVAVVVVVAAAAVTAVQYT